MNGHIQAPWNRGAGFRQPGWRFTGWMLQVAAAGVLFVFLSAVTHAHIQPQAVPLRDRLVSLNLEDADFMQALDAIANDIDATVRFIGEKPSGNRNINLKEVVFGQAVSRIMRMYGVYNHAAAYDMETNTLTVAILRSSSSNEIVVHPMRGGRGILWDHDAPLTDAQLRLLRERSAIYFAQLEESDSQQPLTYEQIELLNQLNADPEDKIGSDTVLSEQQLHELKTASDDYERRDLIWSQPLNEDQIDVLRERALHHDADMQQYQQPLTPDQIQRLRENDQTKRVYP